MTVTPRSHFTLPSHAKRTNLSDLKKVAGFLQTFFAFRLYSCPMSMYSIPMSRYSTSMS